MFSILVLAALLSQPVLPLHTYNGINNGIVVQVELPEGEDVGHLVLKSHGHHFLALGGWRPAHNTLHIP